MTHIEKVYLENSAALFAWLLSKVRDRALAEDMQQDVFLIAQQRSHQLRNPAKAEKWLYQIARNRVNDHFRKKPLRKGLAGAESLAEVTEEAPGLAFEGCLRRMLDHLPEKYREALLEVHFRRKSQLQLAEKLRISYSGAKSRVQRAKEMLKASLMACCRLSADVYGNIVSYSPRKSCDC